MIALNGFCALVSFWDYFPELVRLSSRCTRGALQRQGMTFQPFLAQQAYNIRPTA